jgi:apolipoprotein N-acyltransferase
MLVPMAFSVNQKNYAVLATGVVLLFIHSFWYGSVWTAWLAFVCFAPFFWWGINVAKRPFLNGFSFGILYSLLNMYWLGQFVTKWTGNVLIGALPVFLVGCIWGFFFGIALVLMKFVQLKNIKYVAANPVVFALILFATEYIRMHLPDFLFPFANVGEPIVVYKTLMSTIYSLYLMSFLVMFMNFIFLCGNPLLVQTSIFVIGITLSGGTGNTYEPSTTQTIALGQLGFDMAYGDPITRPYLLRAAVADLSAQAKAAKADVLILPEAVASFTSVPQVDFELSPDLPVLFGAQRGGDTRYQSAFLWDGKGFTFTDKTKLVVFGEHVPFRNIIPYPDGFRLPNGSLEPGTESHPLELKGSRIGAMICFEALFPEVAGQFKRQKADYLAVLSLDDWYVGTSAMPRLQIAARWRAIETRKWVFRVGSLGKTMVINPHGEVVAELPVGSRQLLVYQIKK